MKIFAILLSALIALTTPIIAIADDHQFDLVMNYGLGLTSCGELVQAFRDDSPNMAFSAHGRLYPTMPQTYQEWLAGFITAYNIYASKTGDVGRGIDIHGMMEWVRSYCQENPTDFVTTAASKLVIFMVHKK